MALRRAVSALNNYRLVSVPKAHRHALVAPVLVQSRSYAQIAHNIYAVVPQYDLYIFELIFVPLESSLTLVLSFLQNLLILTPPLSYFIFDHHIFPLVRRGLWKRGVGRKHSSVPQPRGSPLFEPPQK